MPAGAPRPTPRTLDRDRIREALRGLARGEDGIEAADVEPLLAWLQAWRQHWPGSFAALEPDGPRLVERLQARAVNQDRYLKLRRIALANLAAVL